MRAATFVEIDLDRCSLNYGVAPCTAVLGATGAAKCFNSIATCQDRAHFTSVPATVAFTMDGTPQDFGSSSIPSLVSFDHSPTQVSLGEGLGQRASLTLTFRDHRHSDAGEAFDKYLADRSYNPYERGTFWPKFRARHPYLRGRALRLGNALVGEDASRFEVRHFVIDSFDGPKADGSFSIIAKDVLKLADGDRAQAPQLSNGFLISAISNADANLTLSPSGIGDVEYPASGLANIGGTEVVSYTRAGDVMTLTRGLHGTTAAAHAQQDRVQVILHYSAVDPGDIIRDLLTGYAGVPASYIDQGAWNAETQAYLNRVYTALICEPTPVAQLISELVVQAALALWPDDLAQQIRLKVLRPIATDVARYTPSNTLEKSFVPTEQPGKRVSRVQVYFGIINALKGATDPDNFRSSAEVVDQDAESDYGQPAIMTVMSRFIPQFGRTTAERMAAILLGRYRNPPRKFAFSVMRRPEIAPPVLGQGYRIEHRTLVDATGFDVDVPVMVTRLKPNVATVDVEAEEATFSVPEDDLESRQIVIDFNTFNVNLRAVHDTLYPPAASGQAVTCVIAAGVIVGSIVPGVPAFDVGDWPAGVDVTLIVEGRIQGCGGAGGGPWPNGGQDGGTGLYARSAIDLSIAAGAIFGGGGGGGSSGVIVFLPGDESTPVQSFGNGGGGGQGYQPGAGGPFGASGGGGGGGGTTEAPGPGGPAALASGVFLPAGGAGGVAGQPGQPGTSANFSPPFDPTPNGGAAGAAIDGVSHINVIAGPGDIRGAQIN